MGPLDSCVFFLSVGKESFKQVAEKLVEKKGSPEKCKVASSCLGGRQKNVTVFFCQTGHDHKHCGRSFCSTLQEINISHLGKRTIIFKMDFSGHMLVPRRAIPFYPSTKVGGQIPSLAHLAIHSHQSNRSYGTGIHIQGGCLTGARKRGFSGGEKKKSFQLEDIEDLASTSRDSL